MAQGFGCIAYRQSNSEYNDSCDREYQLTADIIYKELARYVWDSEDVKILLSMTGIDM
jgi:hypothetical protein